MDLAVFYIKKNLYDVVKRFCWRQFVLNEFSRMEMIFGLEKMAVLSKARVAVFGVGGVGSYAVEALARCGIGNLDLIDDDVFSVTNINRQLFALHSTVGVNKVDAAAARIKDINPKCNVTCRKMFFLKENAGEIDFSVFDYVLDCVDTVSAKIQIVVEAQKNGIGVISAMGTGNKINPSKLVTGDLFETHTCPLARVMRKELKKRGIKNLKCVYSTEEPKKALDKENMEMKGNHPAPGSVSFVPSVAGLFMAYEAVKDLTGIKEGKSV